MLPLIDPQIKPVGQSYCKFFGVLIVANFGSRDGRLGRIGDLHNTFRTLNFCRTTRYHPFELLPQSNVTKERFSRNRICEKSRRNRYDWRVAENRPALWQWHKSRNGGYFVPSPHFLGLQAFA